MKHLRASLEQKDVRLPAWGGDAGLDGDQQRPDRWLNVVGRHVDHRGDLQRVFQNIRRLQTFFHVHSFTGNPLGCAVALANLPVFRKEIMLTKHRPNIATLKRLLRSLAKLPQVGDIWQQGFMAGIELVKDWATKEAHPLGTRIGHLVARGSVTRTAPASARTHPRPGGTARIYDKRTRENGEHYESCGHRDTQAPLIISLFF
jgi:hypothetical protein